MFAGRTSVRREHAERLKLIKFGRTGDAVDFLERHIRSVMVEIQKCLAEAGQWTIGA